MLRRLPPLIALLAVIPVAAIAAAPRTFVASFGSDANPCSRVLPCRSFQVGHDRTAIGGEVVVLDSGGYGPLLITKSISIDAPAGVHAGITVVGNSTGITIDAVGATVRLAGLHVTGTGGGGGIVSVQADALMVDRCTVSNFVASGTAILLLAANSTTTIRDTAIRHNSDGLIIRGNLRAILAHAYVTDNIRGVIVENGAATSIDRGAVLDNALDLQGLDHLGTTTTSVDATGSVLGAVLASMDLTGGTVQMSLLDNLVMGSVEAYAYGGVALVALGRNLLTGGLSTALAAARITLDDNVIVNSFWGIDIDQAVAATRGNNTLDGNYADTNAPLTPLSAR